MTQNFTESCCIACHRDFTGWERIFVVMHIAQCWAESERCD